MAHQKRKCMENARAEIYILVQTDIDIFFFLHM